MLIVADFGFSAAEALSHAQEARAGHNVPPAAAQSEVA